MLANLLKRWSKSFQKKLIQLKPLTPTASLADTIQAAGCLRQFLRIFEENFSKKTVADITASLAAFQTQLEDVMKWNVFLLLLEKFFPPETMAELAMQVREKKLPARKHKRKSRSLSILSTRRTKGASSIFQEADALYQEIVKRALKEAARLKSKHVEKELVKGFETPGRFDVNSMVPLLNERRDRLFKQIVEIIRTSQKEDLTHLMVEVGDFTSLLEVAVALGYQKAKRLRQVMRVLHERLLEIHDEEMFRHFLYELEQERANISEKAKEMQQLRFIRNRLGIYQANTLQALHAHLPLSLQILKRQLVRINS